MSLLPTQIANFLNTAYEYFSPPNSPVHRTQPIPISREPSKLSSPLNERLDAACQSPTTSLANLSPNSMRRELDITKHDLARAHVDTTRLEERCKMLERTLKETRELLRTREAELEKLRREREKERALAERRRSDTQYHLQHRSSANNLATYQRNGNSLDTRMGAADIARRMHLHDDGHGASRMRTPSPSHTFSPSTSPLNGNSRARSPSRSSTTSTSMSSSAGTSMSNGIGIGGPPPPNSNNIEEERARLRGAETYMSRIDTWSGAQVLQAVHDINSEILQFAASATEMCTFLPSSASKPQAFQETSTRIGPHMARILAARDHSTDPLLVQLALQGCLVQCVSRALASFCIGFPTKSDAVLAQIYAHMQRTEPQPTSAKWRALAHQHIHGIYPTLKDYSISELSDTILRWCADIFEVAHGHSFGPSSPLKSPSSSPPISISPPTSTLPQSLPLQLRALYLDQIRRISRAVLRLAAVTREEIMSTSFELTIPDPAGPFQHGEMIDAFGEYSESEGRVLATTELGLRCVTATGGGDFESRTLLQPKVVLESVLGVLDR